MTQWKYYQRCHKKKEEKVKVQRYLWEVKSLVNPTNFQLDELLGIWEASGFENALPGVFKRAFLKLQTRIDPDLHKQKSSRMEFSLL